MNNVDTNEKIVIDLRYSRYSVRNMSSVYRRYQSLIYNILVTQFENVFGLTVRLLSPALTYQFVGCARPCLFNTNTHIYIDAK